MDKTQFTAMRQFGALIDRIYQGATEPQAWPDVITDIAAWLNAPKGLLFTPLNVPTNGGFYFNHGFKPQFLELWATRYQHMDLWVQRGIEQGFREQGKVYVGEDMVSAEELATSDWYREFLITDDVFHLITSIVFDGNDNSTPGVVCALYRGFKAPSFNQEDKQKLSLLLPHLSRALGVMFKLRDAEFKVASTLAALDSVATGILLLGQGDSVTFANRAARNLLADADGLALRRFHGGSSSKLVADNAAIQAEIDAALHSALEPGSGEIPHFAQSIPVPRPSHQPPYALQFSALAANNEFGAGRDVPRVIVFIADPAKPIQVDQELLKRAYGLTTAEIRVAVTLCSVSTIEDAAVELGVSANTVKSQLQQVYQKTGTDSRAKLAKLIVSLGATH